MTHICKPYVFKVVLSLALLNSLVLLKNRRKNVKLIFFLYIQKIKKIKKIYLNFCPKIWGPFSRKGPRWLPKWPKPRASPAWPPTLLVLLMHICLVQYLATTRQYAVQLWDKLQSESNCDIGWIEWLAEKRKIWSKNLTQVKIKRGKQLILLQLLLVANLCEARESFA